MRIGPTVRTHAGGELASPACPEAFQEVIISWVARTTMKSAPFDASGLSVPHGR